MWSKTRTMLNDRLADSIKDRVFYGFEVYLTRPHHTKKGKGMDKMWSERSVFYIALDKERVFFSNPEGYCYDVPINYYEEQIAILYNGEGYWDEHRKVSNRLMWDYLKRTGKYSVDDCLIDIHYFLNENSIDECLSGENYFLYMLALLDRRLGKRRLKKIVDNIDKEPEWIRKFIIFRAQAEGIRIPTTEQV